MGDGAPVLCVGGIDPSGAAGVYRDLWALQRVGARACAVPSCLTVQNRERFDAVVALPEGYVRAALECVLADAPPRAVKIGLVDSVATWRELVPFVSRWRAEEVPVVVDPVLAPSAGGWAADDELCELVVEDVASRACVLTPNAPELARLGGDAARLVAAGASGVLVTGGHSDDGAHPGVVTDVWHDAEGKVALRRPRHDTSRRGTGCALSALLAHFLGDGIDPPAAARQAGHALWRLWDALS